VVSIREDSTEKLDGNFGLKHSITVHNDSLTARYTCLYTPHLCHHLSYDAFVLDEAQNSQSRSFPCRSVPSQFSTAKAPGPTMPILIDKALLSNDARPHCMSHLSQS
jgi:hypothetical protein